MNMSKAYSIIRSSVAAERTRVNYGLRRPCR